MKQKRRRLKGRSDIGRFLAIPLQVLASAAYLSLSAYARSLLVDIAMQFNGRNNGDLCAAWSQMEKRGWRSRDTLTKSLRQLLDTGFIVKTRQGGKGNFNGRRKATLYAITWKGIDECKGKLDVPANPVPSNNWKKFRSTAGGSD